MALAKMDDAEKILLAAQQMNQRLRRLRFAHPVAYVYNPLEYVWDGYAQYVRRFVAGPIQTLFLGMNPGPWGMAQTGVPFGEVDAVRKWMDIIPKYTQPKHAHPKRPISGVDCRRAEVSGARLWGLMKERFGTSQAFFRHHFVANYCPLSFMEESSRNRTPDKLTVSERTALYQACDIHLAATVEILRPEVVIGVGQFAETRAQAALGDKVRVARILHPSPASPAANRDWSGDATRQLKLLKVW
ncbi:MAG: single-stranded DNA-binding protein [Planctomycetota bacterium]|nr:single-stranded DNA-binding protein [Planctomycetota bacterium]MDA1180406.1 single-stranded DNA-binding protein [Planctomycetota bacterium]